MSRRFEIINGKVVQTAGSPETESERAANAERLGDILRSRTVPACRTTDDFFRNRPNLAAQHGEARAGRIAAGLAKNGYRVKPGDLYNPTAARFPFDPMAVESRTNGGRDHIRRQRQRMADAEERKRERVANAGGPIPEDLVLSEAKGLVLSDERWQRKGPKSKRELKEAATEIVKRKIRG